MKNIAPKNSRRVETRKRTNKILFYIRSRMMLSSVVKYTCVFFLVKNTSMNRVVLYDVGGDVLHCIFFTR